MKVLVFGHQFNTCLGIVRALGAAGAEVHLLMRGGKDPIARSLNPATKSRYLKTARCIYRPSAQAWRDELKKTVGGLCIECVIPGDDFSAALLDGCADELGGVVIPTINGETGEFTEYSSKMLQVELAKKAGLNVPESLIVDATDCDEGIISRLPYPCFCKAESRVAGSKDAMAKCADASEFMGYLDKVKALGTDRILVQEFIDIEEEFCVPGVAYDGEVSIPCVVRKLVRAKGPHGGITVQGELMDPGIYSEVVGRVAGILGDVSFRGLFDFDFYFANGKYYFCEINFRCGTTSYAAVAGGVNLPKMYLLKIEDPAASWDGFGTTGHAVFYNDKALADEAAGGYLTEAEVSRIKNESSFSFLEDSDDAAPARFAGMFTCLVDFKRALRARLR